MINPNGCIRNRENRGFTLLEVLVAATIFSVVVGALYSVFYGALRLREKAYKVFEKNPPKYYVLQQIETDLSNCVVPGSILAGSMVCQADENFKEGSDRLEFYSASAIFNQNERRGDIQKIVYYLKEPTFKNSKGNDLLRETTHNLLSPVEEDPEVERLFTAVDSLKFSFYDGQEWLDAWDSTTQNTPLPQAIAVHITFSVPKDEELTALPIEMVVPIVSTSSAAGAQSSTTGSQNNNNNNSNNNNSNNQNPRTGSGNLPGQSKQPGTSRM